MKLSKNEVEHIAHLARMKISEEEKEIFARQLSGILEYVNQLQEVNTEGVSETSQVTGLTNVTRDDVIDLCPKEVRKYIFQNIPELEGDLLKTKTVFE